MSSDFRSRLALLIAECLEAEGLGNITAETMQAAAYLISRFDNPKFHTEAAAALGDLIATNVQRFGCAGSA